MTITSRAPADFFSPLFFPLISLILSIALCFNLFYQKISLGLSALFWLMLLTGIIYYKNSPVGKQALFCLILALCGWVRTINTFRTLGHFPYDQQVVSLEGTIINKSMATKSRMKYCLTLLVKTINQKNVAARYAVQMYTSSPVDAQIADVIALDAIQLKKPNNDNFNNYLMKEGIVATAFTQELNYRLLKRPTYSLTRWLYNQKNYLLHAFKNRLSKPAFALFASLFLGEKATSKDDIETIQKQFKQWGILHYLARSGLHLVIVLSVYEALFRLLPISFCAKHLLLLLLNLIYFLLSWPSVSFIRAFLIFIFYKLFSLFYIPTHFLHILYVTCIIILLVNPLQLFFLDFQLSFGFTFALGWLNQYKVDQKG